MCYFKTKTKKRKTKQQRKRTEKQSKMILLFIFFALFISTLASQQSCGNGCEYSIDGETITINVNGVIKSFDEIQEDERNQTTTIKTHLTFFIQIKKRPSPKAKVLCFTQLFFIQIQLYMQFF